MKKLLTILGIVVIIAAVAAFNQWYRHRGIVELHTEMAKNVRQALVDRGLRPISWEDLGKTSGEFEAVPDYPADVKALAGKEVTVVGYGIPFDGATSSAHEGHDHASMLPLPLPILESILGHVHVKEFKGVTALLLSPLPLECYWQEVPPVNQVMYVSTSNPVEFADGSAIALTGTLELREQDGPKFFFVLKDAELNK